MDKLVISKQYPERLKYAEKAIRGISSEDFIEVGYTNGELVLLKESDKESVYLMKNLRTGEDYEDDDSYDYACVEHDPEANIDHRGFETSPCVVVDSQGDCKFMSVYHSGENNYTLDEIHKWRLEYFKSLLQLSKEEGWIWSKEECLYEIVGMDNFFVAYLMGTNSPADYAYMVMNGMMD